MKRAKGTIDGMNPKDWMTWLLDHTTIVAEDDPQLEYFKQGANLGIYQLRIIPATGAERFAEYIYNKVNDFIVAETEGRVKVAQVEFREHEKNTAFYKG
jgi:6-pyruvoyltetrahydropterin/6-carboxytetrahydropterin synthase